MPCFPKPYPDFPLTPHPTGKWMKKIKGKLRYFSRWGRCIKGTVVPLEGEEAWLPALREYKLFAGELEFGDSVKNLERIARHTITHNWKRTDREHVPEVECCVYAILDLQLAILYIGSTPRSLLQRLVKDNHQHRTHIRSGTLRYKQVSLDERIRLEMLLISLLSPPLNRSFTHLK